MRTSTRALLALSTALGLGRRPLDAIGKGHAVAMALSTTLGFGRRGFFIPCRYARELPAPGERPPYGALAAVLDRHRADFSGVLAEIERFAGALRAIGEEAPPPAPRWRQDWFPGLDAGAAYTLIRARQPRRIVEVGAGHSTRFAARAVADGGFPCRIVAIDPAPRATLDGLAAVTLVRAPVHRAGTAPFDALEAGDVLFVDSSHVLMPGTDVDFLLNRVLPRLPPAVLVHFHDVFLPDDYPARWAWRGYNEQLAVAALMTGGGYAPVFASHYVATRMRDALRGSAAASLPRPEGAIESSLWLRKL